jgi:UPF0176 protein
MSTYFVAAFYKFVDLPHYKDLREELKLFCAERGIVGTILLSPEGINSTSAGSENAILDLLGHLKSKPEFSDLIYKTSTADEKPFRRMKVKLKKEIVTLGVNKDNFVVKPHAGMGVEVPPSEWNDIISDPDVILIDTRNDYECELGTFKGAIDPMTDKFTEFPDYIEKNFNPEKNKKVAMFCTGGIRCEKASAFMMQMGYETIYQLKGGILKYLEEIPLEKSMWEGECYVFDKRVTIGHGLVEGDYELCSSCGSAVDAKGRQSEKFEDGITCPHCFDEISELRLMRSRERNKQIALAKQRGNEL